MGKRFVPTDEQRRMVESMAAYGIPQPDIARVTGISLDTLMKRFDKELRTGKVKANAKVAESLFKMATDGENVTAAIFWLKTQARWKEPKTEIDVTVGLDEIIKRIDDQSSDRPRLRVIE